MLGDYEATSGRILKRSRLERARSSGIARPPRHPLHAPWHAISTQPYSVRRCSPMGNQTASSASTYTDIRSPNQRQMETGRLPTGRLSRTAMLCQAVGSKRTYLRSRLPDQINLPTPGIKHFRDHDGEIATSFHQTASLRKQTHFVATNHSASGHDKQPTLRHQTTIALQKEAKPATTNTLDFKTNNTRHSKQHFTSLHFKYVT